VEIWAPRYLQAYLRITVCLISADDDRVWLYQRSIDLQVRPGLSAGQNLLSATCNPDDAETTSKNHSSYRLY